MKNGKTFGVAVGLLLVVGLIVGWQWWQSRQSALPDGIVTGNGRIEAVQVTVATKYPGRVASIAANEGDMVERGEVLALMDTAEFEVALAGAEARLAQAEESVNEASAAIVARESSLKLAEQELARALPLAERGSLSKRAAEQHQSARDSAQAGVEMAKAHHRTAEKAVEAARAAVTQVETQLSECVLKAPSSGRVLYRLAEPGEVLAAGGKVLTLLDLDDIYMEIFVSSALAPRIAIGAEARIVVDAISEYVIPATVSFVSPEAQFTPKQVETRDEREKLVFRVKIKVPPEVVAPHVAKVKTGVRGVAYIHVDTGVPWPAHLETKLPEDSL